VSARAAIAIAFSSESASAEVITVSLSKTSTIHVSLTDVLYFAFIGEYSFTARSAEQRAQVRTRVLVARTM
jgi:hypothetical protein